VWRWLLAALLVVGVGVVWATGLVAYRHHTGYFAPVFAADGRSVYAIERAASGVTVGFGYQFWSTPATVFIRRDRHTLINVAFDGTVSRLAELPLSPLTGATLSAYHGSILGSATAHLRREKDGLAFETSVTRHDSPLSRTFTLRGRWAHGPGRLADAPRWREVPTSMGGLEDAQLWGPLEVIALPGEEGFPCAIVTAHRDTGEVRTLRATSGCAATDGRPRSAGAVAALSRRAEIERAATVRRTHAELVAEGLAGGLTEGEAILRANKGMERLGYYPRSPALTATAATCTGPNLFAISGEELAVGLFPDIQRAIAVPGEAVDKAMGDYIRHDAYDTSRQLNEFLGDPAHVSFLVQTGGRCWALQISR
jgi:hypothetical protein